MFPKFRIRVRVLGRQKHYSYDMPQPTLSAVLEFFRHELGAHPADKPDGAEQWWTANGRRFLILSYADGDFDIVYQVTPFKTQLLLETFLSLLVRPEDARG